MLIHDLIPPQRQTAEPFYCLVLHGLGDSANGWKPVAAELRIPELGWCFAQRFLGVFRKTIESTNALLAGQFNIQFTRAKSAWGLLIELLLK